MTARTRHRCRWALLALVLLHAGRAVASGALFFRDGNDARELNGAAFFGFVRDLDGRPVAEAQVAFESRAAKTRLVVQTDRLGHYFFPGFRPEIDPRTVEVSCGKIGYRPVRTIERPPVGKVTPKTPIEIHCTLEKLDSAIAE